MPEEKAPVAEKTQGKTAESAPGKTTERKAAPKIPEDHQIFLGSDKDGKKYGPENNPKRRNAGERFAKYKDGMTVGQVMALDGGPSMADIQWDKSRDYVNVKPPK